jgi:hypothetical protein
LGYCAALAIFAFGLYEAVKSFAADNPTLESLVPLFLGGGLQVLLSFLFLGIRDRFEDRCWKVVAAADVTSGKDGEAPLVVTRQTDGEDLYFADVRQRQSQRLSKRLVALIEQASPDHR